MVWYGMVWYGMVRIVLYVYGEVRSEVQAKQQHNNEELRNGKVCTVVVYVSVLSFFRWPVDGYHLSLDFVCTVPYGSRETRYSFK
jgi:hypothetical protein